MPIFFTTKQCLHILIAILWYHLYNLCHIRHALPLSTLQSYQCSFTLNLSNGTYSIHTTTSCTGLMYYWTLNSWNKLEAEWTWEQTPSSTRFTSVCTRRARHRRGRDQISARRMQTPYKDTGRFTCSDPRTHSKTLCLGVFAVAPTYGSRVGPLCIHSQSVAGVTSLPFTAIYAMVLTLKCIVLKSVFGVIHIVYFLSIVCHVVSMHCLERPVAMHLSYCGSL